MDGWPYAAILKAINARPQMTAAELAHVVVDEYAASYNGATRAAEEEPVTQSAIATANTAATEQLARELVDALMYDPAPVMRTMAQRAVDRTLTFQDRNYKDLGCFAAALAVEATQVTHRSGARVKTAADALVSNLAGRGEGAPVLRLGYLPAYQAASGLSVFLPRMLSSYRREETMRVYRKLVFPQRTGWDRLVEWLL